MGRPRDDPAPNVRTFPPGNHLIIYREVSGGSEVTNVLNARQDYRRIFTDQ